MRFSTLLPLLLAAGVAQAQFQGKGKGNGQGQQAQQGQNNGQQAQQGQNNGQQAQQGQNNGQQAQQGQNNGQNNALCLNPANVQDASKNDGLADAEPGQAASNTDNANFINFCTGKTLTNGLQVQGGSCNGIIMGDIPSVDNMVSLVFTDPVNNDVKQAGSDITFSVQVAGLNAGSFTNPDNTYYAAPQKVDGGKITGHVHITAQFLGQDPNPTTPPNAKDFDFFKGINDDGNGQGLLSATLAGGFDQTGFYRVCTITSASNHQPVVMPVAQRGPQEECVRFEVTADGKASNAGGQNNGQQGQNNGQQAQQGQNNGQQAQQGQNNGQQAQQGQNNGQQAQQGQNNGQQAQQGQNNGQQAQQGQNSSQAQQGQQGGGRRGRGRGRGRFTARDFIA